MGTLSVFRTEWFRGAVNIVELYGFSRVTAAKSLERHAEIYFLNCTCWKWTSLLGLVQGWNSQVRKIVSCAPTKFLVSNADATFIYYMYTHEIWDIHDIPRCTEGSWHHFPKQTECMSFTFTVSSAVTTLASSLMNLISRTANKVCCLPGQSQVHGRDSSRQEVIWAELDRAEMSLIYQQDQYLLLNGGRIRMILQSDLQQVTGMNVADQTIRNTLYQGGLRAQHCQVRCSVPGTVEPSWNCHRTPELAGLPLAPCSFHRWKQIWRSHGECCAAWNIVQCFVAVV